MAAKPVSGFGSGGKRTAVGGCLSMGTEVLSKCVSYPRLHVVTVEFLDVKLR